MNRDPLIDYDRAVDGLGYVSPVPFFRGLPDALDGDGFVEAPCPVCRRGTARISTTSSIAACERGCAHGLITKAAMQQTPVLPREMPAQRRRHRDGAYGATQRRRAA